MIVLTRPEDDVPLVSPLRLGHGLLVLPLHVVYHGRVGVDEDGVAFEAVFLAPHLPEDLLCDGRARKDLSSPLAVEARLVQGPFEALARSLARHFHEAELADSNG